MTGPLSMPRASRVGLLLALAALPSGRPLVANEDAADFRAAKPAIQRQLRSKKPEDRAAAIRQLQGYPVLDAVKVAMKTGFADEAPAVQSATYETLAKLNENEEILQVPDLGAEPPGEEERPEHDQRAGARRAAGRQVGANRTGGNRLSGQDPGQVQGGGPGRHRTGRPARRSRRRRIAADPDQADQDQNLRAPFRSPPGGGLGPDSARSPGIAGGADRAANRDQGRSPGRHHQVSHGRHGPELSRESKGLDQLVGRQQGVVHHSGAAGARRSSPSPAKGRPTTTACRSTPSGSCS